MPQPCKDEEQPRFDAQPPDNVGGVSKPDTGKAEDTGAPIKNEAGDDSTVSLSPKPIASRSLGVVRVRLCMSMKWMNECVDMLFIIRVA